MWCVIKSATSVDVWYTVICRSAGTGKIFLQRKSSLFAKSYTQMLQDYSFVHAGKQKQYREINAVHWRHLPGNISMELEPKVFQIASNSGVLTLKGREFLARRTKLNQNETVIYKIFNWNILHNNALTCQKLKHSDFIDISFSWKIKRGVKNKAFCFGTSELKVWFFLHTEWKQNRLFQNFLFFFPEFSF